jgi:hypothetical protein
MSSNMLPTPQQIAKRDRQVTLGVSEHDIIQREIFINTVKDYLEKTPSGGVFVCEKGLSDIVVSALKCNCDRTSEYTCIFYK